MDSLEGVEKIVQNNRPDEFDTALGRVDFDNLSREDVRNIFSYLILLLSRENRGNFLPVLISYWNELHDNILDQTEILSLYAWTFMQPLIPLEYINVLFRPVQTLTLLGIVGEYINYGDFPVMYMATSRAIDFFHDDNEYTYRTLIQMCGQDVMYIRNALVDKLVIISQYAPIPAWVLFDKITNKEAREISTRLLLALSNNGKKRIEDKSLFQLLGPANPDEEKDERMFTSTTYDWDENDMFIDWFLGYCDNCYRRIRHRVHGVRKPQPYGGWDGVFCSWRCVIENIENQDNLEDIVIQLELVKYIKEQLDQIGIIDRFSNIDKSPDQENIETFPDQAGERALVEDIDIDNIISQYLPTDEAPEMVDSIVRIESIKDFDDLLVGDCPNIDDYVYQKNSFPSGYYDSDKNLICKFDRPIVLLVAKTTCPYCIKLKPWFIEMSQENTNVTFAEVYEDSSAFAHIRTNYDITQFPTVLVFVPFEEGELEYYKLQDSNYIKEELPILLEEI